ncbi:hypothetical protein IWX92DRAFT_65464 [Phyllosticta citricarpa]
MITHFHYLSISVTLQSYPSQRSSCFPPSACYKSSPAPTPRPSQSVPKNIHKLMEVATVCPDGIPSEVLLPAAPVVAAVAALVVFLVTVTETSTAPLVLTLMLKFPPSVVGVAMPGIVYEPTSPVSLVVLVGIFLEGVPSVMGGNPSSLGGFASGGGVPALGTGASSSGRY